MADEAEHRPVEGGASPHEPPRAPGPDVARVLSFLVPEAVGVLTAAYEDDRAGVRVYSVQPCSTEPALVSIALRKGHFIEPLIRDSHHFGLCLVAPSDRLVLRKFPEDPAAQNDDPFDAFPTGRLVSGAPIIERGLAALDCEVVRHFDLEADHEIYVGLVLAAKVFAAADPSNPEV